MAPHTASTGEPRVGNKEPLLSMGFVNIASEDCETEESCVDWDCRSISDSEINYYELGETGSEDGGPGRYSRRQYMASCDGKGGI